MTVSLREYDTVYCEIPFANRIDTMLRRRTDSVNNKWKPLNTIPNGVFDLRWKMNVSGWVG